MLDDVLDLTGRYLKNCSVNQRPCKRDEGKEDDERAKRGKTDGI
jgi:hypothetical protein